MATPQLARETIAPGESRITDGLIAQFKAEALKNQKGIMRRGAHAKTHGLVKAEFVVDENLPEELQVGIFKEAKKYNAWIRFSNSDGSLQPDKKRDVRGMAIKLMDVPGEKILEEEKTEQTQDFILISTNVFVTKDAREFDDLANVLFGGSVFAKLRFFSMHLRTLWILVKALRRFANPLQIRYFSSTPYLFGDRAVKYSASPTAITVQDKIPRSPDDDYLRQAMVEQLDNTHAKFDFAVQFQTDAAKMPIEDPRREWPESMSPFRKVATITIPQQTFDSAEQKRFAEQLSFSPWHSLPEHRPLGSINRVRKALYQALSTFRHDSNHEPRREPTGWEIRS